MVANLKSIKQKGEKQWMSLDQGFLLMKEALLKRYIKIKNKKPYLLLKKAMKRIQLLQKRKISLLVKYYLVMTAGF